jgi:ribonuclease-3
VGSPPSGRYPADPGLLEQRLGVTVDRALLVRSLTHRSFAYENGNLPTNERLEFLGDAVLGLVVTDALYRRHPDLPEGQLAKLRAAVVNMRALAEVARDLDVGAHILLGRGEETSGGRDKSSILADTLEALIGAVYFEHGIEVGAQLVRRLVDRLLETSAQLGAGLDWKTSLQEATATYGLGVPDYAVEEEGPDHAKTFHALVRVGGVVRGTGTGRSKKEAEQQAAATAFQGIADDRSAPALPLDGEHVLDRTAPLDRTALDRTAPLDGTARLNPPGGAGPLAEGQQAFGAPRPGSGPAAATGD